MSKVQNDIKQTHIGNDNVSGISNNIISSPNMLNNSEKCPIPNKDLLSRKVIGLSFTGSGAGLISCPLFIVSVTGFVTALPISLAILGIGTTAAGLYLLLSGNKVRHNNSDNNASGNTNASKNENYYNRPPLSNEYSKEINQKSYKSKPIKIDTERKQSINFDENAQNRQIHDHGINVEQNNGINIKNRPDLTNKDNISNNTSGEIHKDTAFNTKSDIVNDLSDQQKISANSFIHVVNKNNVPELGVGNNIDNNAKNYMPNYAQHSSATEIANKSNINNTIISTYDEIKNIKKSSIQSNGGYNTGTHEQKPNINSDIKIDNSGTHHVLNKANLPNLNKNSITYKNQDAINKNNMYKAMISLHNINENLGANHVAQIEINKNIVDNEKNTEKSDLAPRNEINESFFQEKLNEKLNYKTDNNNSIHIENKNSSNSAEDESIDSNITGNIINKGPSIEINENLKETDRTNFKIDGKINDTKNQNTNPIIDGDNPIISVENINNRTIVDSHTIQGNHPISISGKKNSLREPKKDQSNELTINKNVIKIDKQEFPQKPKDLHEPKPETKQKPEPAEKIPTDFNNQLKSNPVPKPIEEIPPIIPIKQENNDKLEPQSIRKILTELDTIQKSELKPQPKPVKGIPTIPGNLPKPEPRSQSAEGILPVIPIKLENNDKSESQPTEKIFAKLDVIHNNKAGPNPKPKPKEKQELRPKLESPHKLDPEPKPELKPTEEIQIREKFLEYIYPENNKKNVNQKNKQVQGRDAGRANEIPSQIQSKISSIIKDNKNAFRTKKYTNNKDLYKELETISSKLNELFTEYVLDVTKIKDKDKYTTKQLSDISFKEKNNITKVSCQCQIVKDGKSVFDFEFSAGFVKDWKDVTQKPSNLMHNSVSESLRPGKFKFTFKDKNNTPRYVNVDFPIAQPAKNNTY